MNIYTDIYYSSCLAFFLSQGHRKSFTQWEVRQWLLEGVGLSTTSGLLSGLGRPSALPSKEVGITLAQDGKIVSPIIFHLDTY